MIESLRELLDREPFMPFYIVLTSGERYLVADPYRVAIGRTQLNVYAPKSDLWSTLHLNQITSLEIAHAA